MKSKISLFNKSVWKRNLTGGWCLWAGIMLFYLLTIPVNIYASLSDTVKYASSSGEELANQLKQIMISNIWEAMGTYVPFFALAALLCAMYVFSYLFTARNSNMMHAFPVSRRSLFTTNYITGVLFLIIPAMLSALLGLAAGAAHGALDSDVVQCYLLWMVTAAIENVFFFSLAVCVLMFVGNILAVPVMYLIINFLYDGCILILETMLSLLCYGLESYSLSSSRIGVFTPILYFSRRIRVNSHTAVYERLEEAVYNMNMLPGYAAAAALFVIIAIVTYEKKHLETAGDVITVKWLKPIFRWGAAICTSALMAVLLSSMFYTKSFFVILCIVVVTGLIVFFIAQMLLERSVHIFTKQKIRECVIYTAVICVCYLALDLDVVGLEKKIPSMEEIQAAKMSGSLELLANNQEEISLVHDIHSQIIRSKKEYKKIARDRSGDCEYLTIDYLLKDDSILRRRYEIPISNEPDSVSKQLQAYAAEPELILKQYFGIHYPDIEVYGGIWQDYLPDGTSQEIRITEADAKQLYKAVILDVNSKKAASDADESDQTDESSMYADTSETSETDIGCLTLDIRDEAGYINVSNTGIYNLQIGGNEKDGETFIFVNQDNTHIIEKLQELGYLSEKSRAELQGTKG